MPRLIYIFISLVFFLSSHAPVYAANAATFSLEGNKSTVKLSDYKGKIIYLDFWASWCKPCRKSFPFLNELHNKYKQQGLVVIGINLDTERQDANKFLEKFPASFTIAYDPNGTTPQKYKLNVMPTSYLIDQKGQIIYTHQGFKEGQKDDIESKIMMALSKK